MFLGREEGDQAVDRRRDVRGVDRREDEMAGFGGLERGVDSFEIAHLADHDHVGILAERGAQGVGERGGIGPDFALRDDAAVVGEHELDRILDGHDLALALTVDLVEHRHQGRRFTHARRSRHEDEAAANLSDVAEDRRKIQIREGLDLQRDHPQHDVEITPLARNVDSESTLARQLEGEVAFVEIEFLAEGVVLDQDADDLFGVLRRQNLVAKLDELAVEAIERQVADLEMDVGRALLETESEQPVQLFPFHRRSFTTGLRGPLGRAVGMISIRIGVSGWPLTTDWMRLQGQFVAGHVRYRDCEGRRLRPFPGKAFGR